MIVIRRMGRQKDGPRPLGRSQLATLQVIAEHPGDTQANLNKISARGLVRYHVADALVRSGYVTMHDLGDGRLNYELTKAGRFAIAPTSDRKSGMGRAAGETKGKTPRKAKKISVTRKGRSKKVKLTRTKKAATAT